MLGDIKHDSLQHGGLTAPRSKSSRAELKLNMIKRIEAMKSYCDIFIDKGLKR